MLLSLLINLGFGGTGVVLSGLPTNPRYVGQPVLVVSASGKKKWIDYLPVKQFPTTTSLQADRTDDLGALTVVFLGSGTGKVAWVDYWPVVEVSDSDVPNKWRTDDTGFLPVVALV